MTQSGHEKTMTYPPTVVETPKMLLSEIGLTSTVTDPRDIQEQVFRRFLDASVSFPSSSMTVKPMSRLRILRKKNRVSGCSTVFQVI
jgi:hypothetical protein